MCEREREGEGEGERKRERERERETRLDKNSEKQCQKRPSMEAKEA